MRGEMPEFRKEGHVQKEKNDHHVRIKKKMESVN
jgi:hypothetical protein